MGDNQVFVESCPLWFHPITQRPGWLRIWLTDGIFRAW